jgi:hypothetical protein
MKGVNYITDEKNSKTAVVIDLKTLEKYDSEIEDLLDTIIAESRQDEESLPFEKVVAGLKKKSRHK